MQTILFFCCRFLLAFALSSAHTLYASPSFRSAPHSQARLLIGTPQANGERLVGLHIKIDKDWHTYWRNPGDSGTTPTLDLIDDGAGRSYELSPLAFQTPQRFDTPPLTSFGYRGSVVYFATLKPRADVKQTVRTLKFESEWLICKVECVPAFMDFEIDLEKSSDIASENFLRKDNTKVPHAEAVAGSYTHTEGVLNLTTACGEDKVLDFFPDAQVPVKLARPVFTSAGTYTSFSLTISNRSVDVPAKITGLLLTESKNGIKGVETVFKKMNPPFDVEAVVWLLVSAFIGGLILNLMPCVLPVISLKFLSISAARQKTRTHNILDGLAYTAGVIFSFLILAAVILSVREGGEAIGWGFQLQSPGFVAFMGFLFFFLGLNFLGLLHLPNVGGRTLATLISRGGLWGEFLNGVLACVVASPCTAPFMGAAIGASLNYEAPVVLLIFTALGLGVAAPVLLLSCVPAAQRMLPRPGAWMNHLKEFLAFPMFLTSVWMIWLLAQISGANIAGLILVGFVGASAAIWALARWRERRYLAALFLSLIVLIPAGLIAQISLMKSGEENSDALVWGNFSEAALAKLRAEEKIIFVDYTADWCLTCKVNEQLTFPNAEVQAYISKKNINLLKADWTKRDSEITASLKSFGRIGVPLYVLWLPSKSEAVILPEVLTPSIFLDTLKKHLGE